MSLDLENCHLVLYVKECKQLAVGAFDGFIAIGLIEKSAFTDQSFQVFHSSLVSLVKEFWKIVKFVNSRGSDVDLPKEKSLSADFSFQGNIVNGVKSVSFEKSVTESVLFRLNSMELSHLILCLSQAIPFCFLHKDLHILFFQNIIQSQGTLKTDLCRNLVAEEDHLNAYLENFLKNNCLKTPSNSKMVLKALFIHNCEKIIACTELEKMAI